MYEKTLLVLIPAMPLAAAVLTAALGKRVLGKLSHWPTVLAIGVSCILSMLLVVEVNRQAGEGTTLVGYECHHDLWTWADVEQACDSEVQQRVPNPDAPDSPWLSFRIDVTLRSDPLTAIMLAMVTFVSLLVAVYAIGYMHGDPGYWRFFTYIPLFVFSMTMLVSVSNFLLLYVFWEAVGLCSYLLIGFWFRKPEAAAAGKKAFLVNRVGDFGFALGVFLIWTTYGTLNFHDTGGIAGVLGQHALEEFLGFYVTDWRATAICLLLLLGACGKSAQFPLHVWLPDAMEGPTPVSALIHAATMVTAGVYMVVRCMPLFIASPHALMVVAVVGGFTALLAALIALTQNDLKRILAYSTISQLGYMFLALGTAAASAMGAVAGMFHLFTHAFFKGLLFLGAGSVMHAMGGVIDIRRFGGLRHRLPTTHWTFLFGCLALAGVIPFAGFWSKDLVLAAVHEAADHPQHAALYHVLYWTAVLTALLTAFYTFRAFFITFYGPQRIPSEAGDHAHESPRVMTVPLMVLAVCALVVGAFFEITHGFANFLLKTPSLAYLGLKDYRMGFHPDVAATSTVVALAGIGLAAVLYLGPAGTVQRLTRAMKSAGLYGLSHGKFFFDEIYLVLVVWPLWAAAWLCYLVDRFLIDGLVDLLGGAPKLVGAALRPMQNGMIQFYALAMVLGLLVLIGALLM